MSSGLTTNYSLPYPISTDPVDVAGDIQDLADALATFLTNPAFLNGINVANGTIATSNTTANVFNANSTTLNLGGAATTLNIGNASGQANFAGDVNVATGKGYEVNNVSVLTATTLGSAVVSSSLTSVGTLSSGTWSATTIAVDKGGTGLTSYAVGDIVYASGATTLAKLADVATGNALISGGITTAPSWGKVGLTTHVDGILAGTNGGTGVDNSTKTITLGGDLTTSGAYALTLTTTASTNVTLPTTGTITTTLNKLSDFAATTSAELITVISDETGTGSLVFANTPTLTTPNIGAATGSTLSLTGQTITMLSSTSGSPTDNAFFKVERGTSDNVEIRWNETGDSWQFTNDGTTYFDIPTSTGGGAGLQDVLMFAGM
jgi:hypothetical protein